MKLPSEIENEFVQSWNKVIKGFEKYPEIQDLVSRIRAKGFGKTLRAGTGMYDLLIYRARHYHRDNPYISFEFSDRVTWLQGKKALKEILDENPASEFSSKMELFNSKIQEPIRVHSSLKGAYQEFFMDSIEYSEEIDTVLKALEREEIL